MLPTQTAASWGGHACSGMQQLTELISCCMSSSGKSIAASWYVLR
jgi:hypothetical protein